jgi:hypothetical protein
MDRVAIRMSKKPPETVEKKLAGLLSKQDVLTQVSFFSFSFSFSNSAKGQRP